MVLGGRRHGNGHGLLWPCGPSVRCGQWLPAVRLLAATSVASKRLSVMPPRQIWPLHAWIRKREPPPVHPRTGTEHTPSASCIPQACRRAG